MPEKKTRQKAQKAKRQGKAPSTQAGAYVEEEFEHVKKGKHGVKNRKQAIAIGLSKARADGVRVKRKLGKKTAKKTAKRSKSRSSRAHARA